MHAPPPPAGEEPPIEQLSGGRAAFASARSDAWHQLGTTLPDTFDAETAMRAAHLGGWDVRKTPLTTEVDGHPMTVPGGYATVRTHPDTGTPDVLGIVGGQYTPVQNEQLTGFLNALVDESGAHFETAGSLRGGREVFITTRLPSSMTIAGTDELDLYIAGLNSHDGGSPMRVVVTPVRVVCANTQAAALGNARSSWSIRHTAGATGRVEEARQALGMTWRYLGAFQNAAERMIDQTLTDGQFADTVRDLWPLDDNATTRQRNHRDRLTTHLGALFADADTQAAIRGTAWAGYQAVVEHLDHHAPVRGGDKPAARAERTVLGDGTRRLKERAFDAFTPA